MAGNRQGAAGCGNIQFLRRNDQEASRAVLPPKESDLAGAGSPTLADVLFRNAQAGYAQHRHPLSRRHSLGTEICGQDQYADPECGGQGGPAQKEQLSAGLSLGGGDAEDV